MGFFCENVNMLHCKTQVEYIYTFMWTKSCVGLTLQDWLNGVRKILLTNLYLSKPFKNPFYNLSHKRYWQFTQRNWGQWAKVADSYLGQELCYLDILTKYTCMELISFLISQMWLSHALKKQVTVFYDKKYLIKKSIGGEKTSA